MSQPTTEGAAGAAGASAGLPLAPLPTSWRSLAHAFVEHARRDGSRAAMADRSFSLTYAETFLRASVLARLLSRTLGPEPCVGLFLPPTVPSAIANVALALLGKVPVNLNYSASEEVINSAIDQSGIASVITSRLVLDKFKLTPKGRLLFLEELTKQVTTLDKVWGAAVTKLVPTPMLGAFLPGLRGDRLDSTATIIFTSGSTGDPKGVVLSHRNVLSNIHQMAQHIDLLPDESVLGILPFFHSFGFTVCIWTVLCLGKRVAYHFNPLDANAVGQLCEKHRVTLIAATPTFMRTYLHRCEPGQFSSLVHLLLGAEKLKPELAAEIRRTLGIEPMEGYGCTELSPVVAVNVLREVTLADGRVVSGNRPGTVGLPLPGTRIRIVDPVSDADLPLGVEGMVLVEGPQVMVGYLNQPEATARVLRQGWYTTGDLGVVDSEGFLRITDRLSRFSKIGGEMVPHMAVESAIQSVAETDESAVAVTSVPDPKRGERLFVVHTHLKVAPPEICRRLTADHLPRLWVPSPDDFVEVEALPILGSGKIDLRRLRAMAIESSQS